MDSEAPIMPALKLKNGDNKLKEFQQNCATTSDQTRPIPIKAWVVVALVIPITLALSWYILMPQIVQPGAPTLASGGLMLHHLRDSTNRGPCPGWASWIDLAAVRVTDGPDIQRYTSMDTETFKALVDKGEPFVLSDFMKDWPSFGKYNCEYFVENYPDAEYFDRQGGKRIRLGDIQNRQGYQGYECAAGYLWESTQVHVQEWTRELQTPDFLKDFIDFKTAHGGLTGFIGTEHTGVAPHLDELCFSLISMQFSGVKLWSVSRPIQVNGRLEWSKPYVFKIYPGEMLIWFAGQRHHTEVIQGCTFSLTFQLTRPAPVTYFDDLQKVMSEVTQEERDRFFTAIHAADIRYLDGCGVNVEGDTSFVMQRKVTMN